MMRITKYEKEVLWYTCACGSVGGLSVADRLSADCALAIEVDCPVCHANRVVYLLVCRTESKARELSAELEALRFRRG